MVENCGYILCTFIKIKNQRKKKGIELIHVKLPTNFPKTKNTKMKIRMWRRERKKTSSFKLKRVHFCAHLLLLLCDFLFIFIWIINDIYLSFVGKCFSKTFYDTDITISTNMTWRKVYIFHKHITLKNINCMLDMCTHKQITEKNYNNLHT